MTDELVRRLAAAAEADRLAAALDRRGGGFTIVAAEIARGRAAREREHVRWELEKTKEEIR